MGKLALVAVVAGILGFALHALAQTPIDVRPAVMPLGTSSSNGMSFAWFYGTAERRVYVCRIGTEPKQTIDCSVASKLP